MSERRDPSSDPIERIGLECDQLLRRVQALVAAAAERRTGDVQFALRILAEALRAHFATEEAWMEDQGYPAARRHARLHAGIVARFVAARDEAAAGGVTAVAAAELARVIEEHVRTDDLNLGRYAAARQNLRILAEVGPGELPAPSPIPGAKGAAAIAGKRAAGAE